MLAMMMFKICIFDTETNGLPKECLGSTIYPDILQIGWAIYDILLQEDKSFYSLRFNHSHDYNVTLAPEVLWDSTAEKFHGISEKNAKDPSLTVPISVCLNHFFSELQSVNCIIAHNLRFDISVIRSACFKAKIPFEIHPAIQTFCTMETMRPIMKIPSTNSSSGFKSPKLSELFHWVWGGEQFTLGRAHTAKGDVECLSLCVAGLFMHGIIQFDGGKLIIK